MPASTADRHTVATMHSHYDLLDVPADADTNTITRAYRRRAQLLHPDRHPGDLTDVASQMMAALNDAHRTLTDPQRRAAYDRQLDRADNVTDGLARHRQTADRQDTPDPERQPHTRRGRPAGPDPAQIAQDGAALLWNALTSHLHGRPRRQQPTADLVRLLAALRGSLATNRQAAAEAARVTPDPRQQAALCAHMMWTTRCRQVATADLDDDLLGQFAPLVDVGYAAAEAALGEPLANRTADQRISTHDWRHLAGINRLPRWATRDGRWPEPAVIAGLWATAVATLAAALAALT